MPSKLPAPAVAAACFEVRDACDSLDSSALQQVLFKHGDTLVAVAGPGSSHLDPIKRRLLDGTDIHELNLPESVKQHLRAGLTLSVIGCGGTPAQHVTAALLGQPITTDTWPQFTQELAAWKGKPPATWPPRLTQPADGLATGNAAIAALSPQAKDILALANAIKKEVTGEPDKFWVPTSLHLHDRLFPAIYELENIKAARGSDPPDRLQLLTLDQLNKTFAPVPDGLSKAQAIAHIVNTHTDDQIHTRLTTYSVAASPTLLTIGLNAGKDADWLLDYSELLANHLITTAQNHHQREQARLGHGTPGGWHLIRKGRCRICKDVADPIAEHDPLPPFHIGCTCRVIADGPHGMTPDQIAAAKKAPAATPGKAPSRTRVKAPKGPATPKKTASPRPKKAAAKKQPGFVDGFKAGVKKGKKGRKSSKGLVSGVVKTISKSGDSFKFGKF